MTTVSAVVFLYSPKTMLASVAIVNLDEAGDIGAGGGDGDADRRHLGARVLPRYHFLQVLARPPHAGLAANLETMIIGNDPILLTPGPLTTSLATKQAMLRDWGSWDAAFNAITARICRDLRRRRPRRGHARVRAAAGQRHLLGGGGARQPRAARRQGAGAAERRLLPAHPEDPARSSAARTSRSTCRGQASDRRDGRGGAARRSVDHARGAGALRDRHRHPQPAAGDRRRPARATARASSSTR